MDSKSAAKNKLNIHISYYDPSFPNRLLKDVERSPFTTRSKYLKAILEKTLSLPLERDCDSNVGELFARLEWFDTLPINRIRQLALVQNRNFEQMVKHLLEIALSYYPEEHLLPEESNLQLASDHLSLLRTVDDSGWPTVRHGLPPTRSHLL